MKGWLEKFLYYRSKQARAVVGIDEAGRGSLSGPVAVSAVVFPSCLFSQRQCDDLHFLKNVDDSKKLTAKQRENCYFHIRKWAVFAETVYISNRHIDRMNINKATEYGIVCLVRRLHTRYFAQLHLLVDGNFRLPLLKQIFPFVPYVSIIKGDSRVFSIAAASIIAKVDRDKRMGKLAKLFPAYTWEKNKGYPTLSHRKQIKKIGMSGFHRLSYGAKE